MKQWLVGVSIAAAACGGGKKADTIGETGGKERRPAIVMVAISEEMAFEAACFAPDCTALRARMLDGKQTVEGGGSTWRIVKEDVDVCGASGDENQVVRLERVGAASESGPGVLVWPAGTDVGLELANDAIGGPPAAAAVTPELAAMLARVATADLVRMERPREVRAAEISVEQIVSANVEGGPAAELLVAAVIELPEDEGPGYAWAALVVAPDGDLAKARSVWTSELEHLTIDATFDLEGDGVRELLFTAAYYEGSMFASGSLRDGKLEVDASWACGA